LARNLSIKSHKLNVFSSLLKEIADDDAIKNRALVSKIINTKKEDIQKLIESAWEDDKSDNAKLGNAAERTIAHLDRVGFFLLTKGNNPQKDSPEWLWTIVKNMWGKLRNWVEYRQEPDENNLKFYHKAYGLYFKKLYNYGIEHKLIIEENVIKELIPHVPTSG
jgi:hypothetical protein